MIASKLKRLATAKAIVTALERQIEAERAKRTKELANLPAKFGFASVGKFAATVLRATPRKKRKVKARRVRPSPVRNLLRSGSRGRPKLLLKSDPSLQRPLEAMRMPRKSILGNNLSRLLEV